MSQTPDKPEKLPNSGGKTTSDKQDAAQPSPAGASANSSDTSPAEEPTGLLARNPWVPFVIPMVVYMLANSLEPRPPGTDDDGGGPLGLSISFDYYPLFYAGKIAVTLIAIALVWPGFREFRFRVSPLSVIVGIVGAVVWIGLCQPPVLDGMGSLLSTVGLSSFAESGERSGFNPLEHWADAPAVAYGFLALRFFGMVAVVAWIEEFFWRAFLLRFLQGTNWWTIEFGTYQLGPMAATTIVFALAHPLTEFPAAVAWFAIVTWLMLKTRNIYDCIIAHAITNLLLGIYVVATGAWYLM